jgi:hypothetical protein
MTKTLHKTLQLTVAVLALTGGVWAQSLFAVRVIGKQKWPAQEAEKLYLSACSVVQQEFGTARPVRPRITLVLGAEDNQAFIDKREIRLTRWNPYLFAQGVVIFAFEDLMDGDKKLDIAMRAVRWADSVVEVNAISK